MMLEGDGHSSAARSDGHLEPTQAGHAACACHMQVCQQGQLLGMHSSVRQDSSPGVQQRIPEVFLQPGASAGAGTAGVIPIPKVLCMPVMLQQRAAVK